MTKLIPSRIGSRLSLKHLSSKLVYVFGLTLIAGFLQAHAVLENSTPGAHEIVRTDHLTIALAFNSRVDSKRSQITLISAGGTQEVPLDPQKAPNTLQAKANGLKAGAYRLIWQVLAADGHITRGQIPFEVQ